MKKITVLAAATTIAVSLMSIGTASAGWVGASGSSVPADAVPGGKESNGAALYLCRAKYGTQAGNDGVHPGKTRKEFNGCNIGWGGKEVAVPSYEVLVTGWQATSGANIPGNAVATGQEKEGPLYTCRASHQGGVHMGKTRKEFNGCNIGYGGAETVVPAYEVMVDQADGKWVGTSGSSVPADAIPAGKESNGTPLYLCRAKYGSQAGNDGMHPGKTRKEFNGCNIGWGGKEVAVPNYEVLVTGWQATSGANIPGNAIATGQEKEGPLYTCRASHQGGVHMGKTRKEFNGCNIGYGGTEVIVPAYEVLVK